MERIFTILVIASLTILGFPAASAAETVTEEYTGTAGSRIAGYGTTPSWRPCPGGCNIDADGDGEAEATIPDTIKFGGGPLFASQYYTNVIIRVTDEVYGNGAATQACFWNPEGVTTNICEGGDTGEDHLSDTVCGTLPLLGSPYPGNRVTVWVYTLVVTEDLGEVCGGHAGTMTGDFF